MAQQQLQAPSAFRRFWTVLSAVSNLQTLWQLAIAAYATSKTVSRLPGGWHPPQYWAIAAFVFFGTWAATWTLVLLVVKLSQEFRRWRDPATFSIAAHGGDQSAYLELVHTGVDESYSVEGKIETMMGQSPNPAPGLFRCPLRVNGGIGSSRDEVVLRNREWIQIPLAVIAHNNFSRAWLAVRRGHAGDTEVPDEGAILALTIARHGKRQLVRVKVARVYQRRGGGSFITAELVTTDAATVTSTSVGPAVSPSR